MTSKLNLSVITVMLAYVLYASTAAAQSPQTWFSGDYAYDTSGNIKSIGATVPNSNVQTNRYTYDTAGRLVNATVNHATVHNEQYHYDAFGNMTARGVNGGSPAVIGVNPQSNRLTGHTYDPAGNLATNGSDKFAFDAFNMLRGNDVGNAPDAFYIYTADDERIAVDTSEGLRWTIRDFQGKVLREFKGGQTGSAAELLEWSEDLVYREGQLVAAERPTSLGGRRHFHLDHLGSVRLVTKSNRMKLSAHDYTPFGRELTPQYQELTNWDPDEGLETRRFTSHERDYTGNTFLGESSLDYMHARYYAAGVGRFLSLDPIRGDVRQPQSLNRYGYVMNNPTNFVDPFGLQTTYPGGGGGKDRPEWCPEGHECVDVRDKPRKSRFTEAEKRAFAIWGLRQLIHAGIAIRAAQVYLDLRYEMDNLRYWDWSDAEPRKHMVPCKGWADRWAHSYRVTNGLPGTGAPSLAPGVGIGTITSGATAEAARSMTAMQWARTSFSGSVYPSGVAATSAETGIAVGATSLGNALLVGFSWEIGVGIGSAVNASISDGCNH